MTEPAAMRVTLVIANLDSPPGGAQRVMVTMANHWAAEAWQVTLIALDAGLERSYFPLHPAVRVVYLGVAGESPTPLHGAAANLRRVVALRRAVRASDPHLVISFLSTTNVLTLLATRGLGVPVVVSERGDPRRGNMPRAWRLLRTATYPLAYRLVAQTEAALACFPARIRRRGVVLPNPVALPALPAGEAPKTVVGVGHLLPVKGFDILIEAFARCTHQHPDWRLVIWGEGADRAKLEALAGRLGIGDRFELAGLSTTPGAWLAAAGIFVLASRHEGFPNVLLEAMAAGLPVIAADCPVGGCRALIEDGKTGLLVPKEQIDAMAAALERLMADPITRQRLGEAARRGTEAYALPRIMERWTALAKDAVAAHARRSTRAAAPRSTVVPAEEHRAGASSAVE